MRMFKYKPIANRVIFLAPKDKGVEGDEFFGSTKIIKPAAYSEKEAEVKTATALYVGDGIWEHGVKIPMTLKPGDRFEYHPLSVHTSINRDGMEYSVISESDILAVIEGFEEVEETGSVESIDFEF